MVANNRIHPRVKIQLTATLESDDHEVLELVTENVSMSGAMLDVSREDFLSILGNSDPQFAPNRPATRENILTLSLPAPGKGRKPAFVSHCRAIHVRRISQNRYLIGLKFTQIKNDGATQLKAFIDQSLKTAK